MEEAENPKILKRDFRLRGNCVICISDTHGHHEKLIVPPGDILIHCGDITEAGTRQETLSFLKWFSKQPHKHKIFVAGNHDFFLEGLTENEFKNIIPENVHYLCENGVEINGKLFWGSPIITSNESWAFVENSDKELYEHWEKIPEGVDVLITHSPPHGIMDITNNKEHLGCKQLKQVSLERKPQFHIFGHAHDNYGKVRYKDIFFVNATSFNNYSRLINPPLKLILS